MAKREQLEASRAAYGECIAGAQAAASAGRYLEAIQRAASAWNYINEAIQYQRKYDTIDFRNPPCIELVLRYSPFLFHRKMLDRVQQLLKEHRSIQRHAPDDLNVRIDEAYRCLETAYRIWDAVEKDQARAEDALRQHVGIKKVYWKTLVDAFVSMRLLMRVPDADPSVLQLVTDMSHRFGARCSECGVIAVGRKRSFLKPCACPGCKKEAMFVLCQAVPDKPHER